MRLNANVCLDFSDVTNVDRARRMVAALVLVKARFNTMVKIYPEKYDLDEISVHQVPRAATSGERYVRNVRP